LCLPWMKKVAHLQGKNPRMKLIMRVSNPSKRSKNYPMILLRTMKT
jgi:hypothetical protein